MTQLDTRPIRYEPVEWKPDEQPRAVFDCLCEQQLIVQRTECGKCGAHYDYRSGQVVVVAPPMGTIE